MELYSIGSYGLGRVTQITNVKYFLKDYILKNYENYKSYSSSVGTKSVELQWLREIL